MGSITINGQPLEIDPADAETPLLWVIRELADDRSDQPGLMGTKYGCGIARCGACTVHLEDPGAASPEVRAIRSCVTPASTVFGMKITTIEGLSQSPRGAVQTAWSELSVPQCGFCQSGQIMSAIALLEKTPKPSKEEVDIAMSGNLCRCGTYCAIRKGIKLASELIEKGQRP